MRIQGSGVPEVGSRVAERELMPVGLELGARPSTACQILYSLKVYVEILKRGYRVRDGGVRP